ncbi:hypothetical protein K388_07016 [Streptomyces sp. KhCrAH-43]|nr:hypothetical protein K388_07016 [Streptomyces sp. KhCrAH-43]
MERGLVGEGELVRSYGQVAPVLEASDAPLNRVALLVRRRVESRRATAGAASPQPVAYLVGQLGFRLTGQGSKAGRELHEQS